MSTQLRLLGGVAVRHGEATELLSLDRPITLLIYLGLRGDWVRRSELALLYRPDSADDEALAYLRKLVFRARRYSWAQGLEVAADHIRWLVDCDVTQFLTAARTGDHVAALELYRGTFLAGAHVEDAPGLASWLDMERGTLSATWLRVALARAEELNAGHHHEKAAELLAQVVAADPLAEENLQIHMRTLVAAGRNREALQAFEQFRLHLEEEIGSLPLESTMVLADSIRQAGGNVRQAGPRVSALPEPVTAFIGRTAELEELAGLLVSDETRLVTIVGLGGSGKTRLALEAARRYRDAGLGRVVFVPLVGVTRAARLATELLEHLELPWDDGPAEEAVIDGLRHASALILLDNFEEVLSAAPFLTRLLSAAPGIRLLVTSREPLKVSGEWRADLGGLLMPDGTDVGTGDSDAVRLFVQRAARTASRFTATGSALKAIADICRQLEGMPLAIELAAGWIRLLQPAELSRQLADRRSLLTSDLLDIPERHRSIWSVFDHTWVSLSESERTVLTRLTVFRGGFSLQAAQRVAGADLGTLLGLLDRLLVRRQEAGRFVLHELVRQYAQAQGTTEELAAASVDHSSYYCGLLATLAPDLKGRDVQSGLEAVASDGDNFEAAWYSATERLDLTALENAREALDYYFYYRAHIESARNTFGQTAEALLQLATRTGSQQRQANQLRGLLEAQLAEKEFGVGEFTDAIRRIEAAVQILGEWGTEVQVAHARLILGNGLVRCSRFAEARPHFREVLASAERVDDDYLLGASHNGLANLLAFIEGDIPGAEEHYRASLQAHSRVGNLEGVTGALTNLGACRFDLDDLAGAERLWREGAETAASIGFRDREAALLNNLGSLREALGDFAAAGENFRRSLNLRRELGNRQGIANVLMNLGRLTMRGADKAAAIEILLEAAEISRQLGDRAGETQARSYLARAWLGLERHDEAVIHLGQALELAVETDSHRDLLGALFTAALIQEAEGRLTEALATAVTVASGSAGRAEPLRVEAESLAARLAADSGAQPDASALQTARELAGELLSSLRPVRQAGQLTRS